MSETSILELSSSNDEDDDLTVMGSGNRSSGTAVDDDDDDVVIIEKPIGSFLRPKKKSKASDDDDEDDCCIIEAASSNVKLIEGTQSDGEELVMTGEIGPVACRDFPHARHLCALFPFKTSKHEDHCELCHCYVCDKLAPCKFWNAASAHCNASDKEEHWTGLRKAFKRSIVVASTNPPFPTKHTIAVRPPMPIRRVPFRTSSPPMLPPVRPSYAVRAPPPSSARGRSPSPHSRSSSPQAAAVRAVSPSAAAAAAAAVRAVSPSAAAAAAAAAVRAVSPSAVAAAAAAAARASPPFIPPSTQAAAAASGGTCSAAIRQALVRTSSAIAAVRPAVRPPTSSTTQSPLPSIVPSTVPPVVNSRGKLKTYRSKRSLRNSTPLPAWRPPGELQSYPQWCSAAEFAAPPISPTTPGLQQQQQQQHCSFSMASTPIQQQQHQQQQQQHQQQHQHQQQQRMPITADDLEKLLGLSED